MADDERDFYQSLPISGRLRRRGSGRELSSAARRLVRRPVRHRRLDQGDRRGTLQGGQHDRGRGDRSGLQCARRARFSVRLRRRWREFRRRTAARARGGQGARGHGGLLARRIRHGSQGRDDRGRRHPGRRPRRPRRPLRGLAPCGLCDVHRRRAFLVRGARQARRLRAAGRPRRAPGSVGPLLSLDCFAG